jgi:hypothetical protein
MTSATPPAPPGAAGGQGLFPPADRNLFTSAFRRRPAAPYRTLRRPHRPPLTSAPFGAVATGCIIPRHGVNVPKSCTQNGAGLSGNWLISLHLPERGCCPSSATKFFNRVSGPLNFSGKSSGAGGERRGFAGKRSTFTRHTRTASCRGRHNPGPGRTLAPPRIRARATARRALPARAPPTRAVLRCTSGQAPRAGSCWPLRLPAVLG